MIASSNYRGIWKCVGRPDRGGAQRTAAVVDHVRTLRGVLAEALAVLVQGTDLQHDIRARIVPRAG